MKERAAKERIGQGVSRVKMVGLGSGFAWRVRARGWPSGGAVSGRKGVARLVEKGS